jgi:histone H3/H4
VYEEIRVVANNFLTDFIRRVIIITEYHRRKTVSINDIYEAATNYLLITEKKIPKCKEKATIDMCLEFAQVTFQRIVRQIAHDFNSDTRFEKNALVLIQYYTEQYLLKLLYDARLVMQNSRRQTLQPKDIGTVLRNRMV